MAKEKKIKEPIKVRQKMLRDGNISLYLDIYKDGKRTYEFLKLYLTPERTREDKEKNRQTLQLANSIKAKRIVELQNKAFGFKTDNAKETRFFDYFEAMISKKREPDSTGNWWNWHSCLQHLRIYEKNEAVTFADITPEWVQGFHDYLENDDIARAFDVRGQVNAKPLSQNTRLSYFNKLRSCLQHACEDGIISFNPSKGIENFKKKEGTRMYLTIEEVRKLAQTDCEHPRVKDAFLFSCLTGLRRSDIEKLTWSEVHEQGDFTRIIFRQKKTKGLEYLDITPQAAELMGMRGKPEDRVFQHICTPVCTNYIIQAWVTKAGIDKRITFHCGRHTFAIMMLDIGTDIYTVSKLLGHRELSTTQIYAKVLDKNKQKAVASIPNVLNKEE